MKKLIILTLMGLITLSGVSAKAATYHVNMTEDVDLYGISACDGFAGPCSLRTAIRMANSNLGLDTVYVPKGTYSIDAEKFGFGGLEISDYLNIIGEGQTSTIIDGQKTDIIFNIFSNGFPHFVSLQDLSLVNASQQAIIAQATELILSHITVRDNQLTFPFPGGLEGGVIECQSCAVNIADSQFINNSFSQGSGSLSVNSGFRVDIINTLFKNNSGDHAGAIHIRNTPRVNIENSIFKSNDGEALRLNQVEDAQVNNSVLTDNQTGILLLEASNLVITNSTLSQNGAIAGIQLGSDSQLSLEFSTLVEEAPALLMSGVNSNIEARSSIISNINGGDTCVVNPSNNVNSLGFNLDSSGACLTSAIDLSGDPQLASLADNGGSTLTHAPLDPANNPIVGASNCEDINGDPIPQDQRGAGRPTQNCTIGAYESQPTSLPPPSEDPGMENEG